MRKTSSGAASIGLGNKVKYPRRTTGAAAGNCLGTTLNYLRGAAGNGRAQGPSTFDAQRAPPRKTAWGVRTRKSSTYLARRLATAGLKLAAFIMTRTRITQRCTRAKFILFPLHISRVAYLLLRQRHGAAGSGRAPRPSTCEKQRAAPRASALAPRLSTRDAQRPPPRAAAGHHAQLPARRRGQRPGATIKYL